MSEKNICLLGFSKASESKIRLLIEENTISSINWVSANHHALSGIVINAPFLDTPQIQKLIQTVTCPCLSIFSNKDAVDPTKLTQLMFLNIDKPAETDQMWFSILLGTDYRKADTFEQDTAKHSIEELSKSTQQGTLLDAIDKKSHDCLIAEYEQYETWILPKQELVLINYPRENIVGIEMWQWSPREEISVPESFLKMRLDQWLFETIWQSHLPSYQVDQNASFQLLRWPQPLSKLGRTEALRIAASIKLEPATLDELVSKTNYGKNLIEKFLYAALKSKQIKSTTKIATSQHSGTSVKNEAVNSQEIEHKRSFLERLRNKLGLG